LFADSIIDDQRLTAQRYFYINLSRESIGQRESVNSVDTQQRKKWKSSDEYLGRKYASQFTQSKNLLHALIQKEKSKIEHLPSIEFRQMEMVSGLK
jgi:hypothetical protein